MMVIDELDSRPSPEVHAVLRESYTRRLLLDSAADVWSLSREDLVLMFRKAQLETLRYMHAQLPQKQHRKIPLSVPCAANLSPLLLKLINRKEF